MAVMLSHRPLPWLVCALPVVVANSEPAHALQGSKAFIAGPSLVVEIEGRKGTRLYRPDDASTEPQETADPKQAKEKLDQCMASWDKGTHISQSNWRQICAREIKSNE